MTSKISGFLISHKIEGSDPFRCSRREDPLLSERKWRRKVLENAISSRFGHKSSSSSSMVGPGGEEQLEVEAYVTHLTNDQYIKGAQVLAESLREAGATRPPLAMITEQVSGEARNTLRSCGWTLVTVPEFGDGRKDLNFSRGFFTKLEAWRLPCTRVIYLDTDILAVGNPDVLFELAQGGSRPDFLFAVQDSQPHMQGHAPIPNTGVMVLKPDIRVYARIVETLSAASATPLHEMPFYEQGFIGKFFAGKWVQLPAKYNFCVRYLNRPLYQDIRHRDNKVFIHYAKCKPWDLSLQRIVLQEAHSQGFGKEYLRYIRMFTNAANRYGYHHLVDERDGDGSGVIVWNDIHEEVITLITVWVCVLFSEIVMSSRKSPLKNLFVQRKKKDVNGEVSQSDRRERVEALSEVPDAD
eukprot:jgi/Bigna1/135215/aug1.28_g9923